MNEGLFNKDSLLGSSVRRFATVEIENLGKVRIRSLTEGERSRVEASMIGKAGEINTNKLVDMKCRMIVECVVDADGNQLYSNTDIDRLRQQDCKVTSDIATAIESHCGISKADLENLEKKIRADVSLQAAFVLARDVEHTVDIGGMLDRMSPRQFAAWCLMYKIWEEQSKSGEQSNPQDDPLNQNAMQRMAGV